MSGSISSNILLQTEIPEANDRVTKSNGDDVRGTWLQIMCCTLPKHLCPQLTSGVKDRECWRWLELGWRCHTRVGQRETKLEVIVRIKANED